MDRNPTLSLQSENFSEASLHLMDREKIVELECIFCGYVWVGPLPKSKITLPLCPRCRNFEIAVKDWLLDKERWEQVRNLVLERDEYACHYCGKREGLQVHHLHYDDFYNPESMIALCNSCHEQRHQPFLAKFAGWFGRLFKKRKKKGK